MGHRNGAGQSFDSMVITQKGIICYQQGYEVATQMPKVEVSDLKVNMTTSVPYPSSNESATNKYYVDSNHYKKSEIDSSLQTIETNLNYNIQGALDSSKSYTDLKHSELKALLDTILKDAPTAYDTLKEIADYIASDKSGASEMLSKINNNTSEINVIKQGLPETLDIILRSEVSEGTIEEVKEMEINGMKFKVGSATSSDSALKLKLVASGTLELNNDEETYKKIYDFENSKLYAITLDSNSALLIGYCNDEIFQTQFAPEYANDNIIYIRQEVNNDYTSIHKEEGSVATEYSGIQYEVYELVAPVGSGGGGSRQVLTWDDIKNQVDFSLRDEVDGIIDMEGIDLSNKELIIDLVEDTYDSMPIWAYVRKYIIGNDIINTQDSYSMSVRINNQWDNFKIKIKSREDYYEDYFYGYGMAIGVEVDTKLISCTNDLRSTGTCYYGEINYITYDVVGENVLEVSGYKENNYIRVDYIYEFEV